MKTRLAGTLLLIAASLVCYANGLDGDFTYDDKAIIRDNARIQAPGRIGQIFSTPYFGGPRGQSTGYRPVLLLSFAVQWWAHGGAAFGFHAGNVLLHVLVTLLLARLLDRLGFPSRVSFAAALLFAVHPIHVEAVTSLVGRGETLAAAFVLGFLLLVLRYRDGPRRRRLALAGALACYALGILSKESAAVAPGLALLAFWRLEPDGGPRRILGALARSFPVLAGSAVLLAGTFALRGWVLGGFLKAKTFRIYELENPLAPLPALERLPNAAAILFRYVGRLLAPLRLSADESAWSIPPESGADPIGLAALLLLVALGAAAVTRERVRPAPAFGFLFFAVAFAAAANLFFPTGTIFAERLAYLPSAGFALALAAAIPRGESRTAGLPRGVLVLASLALLFGARTVARNTVWQSDESLFVDTVRASPASAKAHYNLAWSSAERGRLVLARAHYDRATRIYDRYHDAWAGKGVVEQRLGLLADAERSFRRSLAINPGYENGFFRLGFVRELRKDDAAAERAYAAGLSKNRRSTPLAYRLAIVRSRLGRRTAEEDWLRAIGLAPSSATFRVAYARWLVERGRAAEARRQAREVLRRRPWDRAAITLIAETSRDAGRRFAEGLAVERIFRASRSPADFDRLARIAADDPAYAARFAARRDSLARIRIRPPAPR